MNKSTALADAIRRCSQMGSDAIDAIDAPGADFDATARKALVFLKRQAELAKDFQAALDDGTLLNEIEVYTQTYYHGGPSTLVEYWRLMPGSSAPIQLSGQRGYVDWTEATKHRRMAWPDAYFVTMGTFDLAVSDAYKREHEVYRLHFGSDSLERQDTQKYIEHYYEGGD